MSFRNNSTPGSALLSPPACILPGGGGGSQFPAACAHRHQLPPVPSPFIYSAEQAGSSVKGEAGNKDAIQISALSQGAHKKRVRQRRKRSPGCTGSADLPSEGWEERHLGRSRSSRGAPGSRGLAQRAARLGALLRRQRSALHRISLPPSGRVSDTAAGAEGLPQSGKTRKPDLARPAITPPDPLQQPCRRCRSALGLQPEPTLRE